RRRLRAIFRTLRRRRLHAPDRATATATAWGPRDERTARPRTSGGAGPRLAAGGCAIGADATWVRAVGPGKGAPLRAGAPTRPHAPRVEGGRATPTPTTVRRAPYGSTMTAGTDAGCHLAKDVVQSLLASPQPRKGVYTLPGHMIDLARHGRGVQVSPVLAPPLLRTRARTRRRPGREVERCGRSSAPLLACEPWWLASGGTTCRAQPWSAGAQGLERELRGARQSETALRAMAGVVRKFM
ncbi:unnamed protein product, partial [Prorocentrum cordatum]